MNDPPMLMVFEQSVFRFSLVGVGGECQEIKVVRIFEELLCEIRLRRGKSSWEVGDRLALPRVKVGLDPMRQHRAGPAIGDRLQGVPNTLVPILQLLDQNDVVEPRHLGHR